MNRKGRSTAALFYSIVFWFGYDHTKEASSFGFVLLALDLRLTLFCIKCVELG